MTKEQAATAWREAYKADDKVAMQRADEAYCVAMASEGAY